MGGRAALSLAESGVVERVAAACTPVDLEAVTVRFSALTAKFEAAGVTGPDVALRTDFDAWRAVYDNEILPQIQALDAAMVDTWLVELDMPWTNDWERYLAVRSAFWLEGRGNGQWSIVSSQLSMGPALTGALQADLLQIHNQLDPVAPISQMVEYQKLAVHASAGDRIAVAHFDENADNDQVMAIFEGGAMLSTDAGVN